MSYATKNFNGEIDGCRVSDFYGIVNRNLLTATERIRYLDKILYTSDGYPIRFFEELFEQKFDKQGRNVSYINLLPNNSQSIYSETNVAKMLSSLGDYILESKDQRDKDKKQKYKIYRDKQLFNKIMREQSTDRIQKEYGGDENVIDILINNKNYKTDTSQQILPEDFNDIDICDILKEYQDSWENIKKHKDKQVRIASIFVRIKKRTNNFEKLHKLKPIEKKFITEYNNLKIEKEELENHIKYLSNNIRIAKKNMATVKEDMLDVKDQIKGIIYFKDLLPESTVGCYDLMDFMDTSQIREVILHKEQDVYDFQNDFDCILYIGNELCKKVELTEVERLILDMFRKGVIQVDMAKEVERKLGVDITRQECSRIIEMVMSKICDLYTESLKEFLVEFRWEGIKKCSRCGEWKLHEDFKKDAYKLDGFRYNCKKCE